MSRRTRKPASAELDHRKQGLKSGWPVGPGVRIRMARVGDVDAAAALIGQLDQVVVEDWLREGVRAGTIADALIAGELGDVHATSRRVAHALASTRGDQYDRFAAAMVAAGMLLVAVDRAGRVIGALMAFPPGRMVDAALAAQAVTGAGNALTTMMVGFTRIARIKAVVVDNAHRGAGIGRELLHRAIDVYRACGYTLVYGEFYSDGDLDAFYRARGALVLDPGEAMNVTSMIDELIIAPAAGERLFAWWLEGPPIGWRVYSSLPKAEKVPQDQWQALRRWCDDYTAANGGRFRSGQGRRAARAVAVERGSVVAGTSIPRTAAREWFTAATVLIAGGCLALSPPWWLAMLIWAYLLAVLGPHAAVACSLLRSARIADRGSGQLRLIKADGCVLLTDWSYWPRAGRDRLPAQSAYRVGYDVLAQARDAGLWLVALPASAELTSFYASLGFAIAPRRWRRPPRGHRFLHRLAGRREPVLLRNPEAPLPPIDALLVEHTAQQ